jgi:hypothetical protein
MKNVAEFKCLATEIVNGGVFRFTIGGPVAIRTQQGARLVAICKVARKLGPWGVYNRKRRVLIVRQSNW